METTQTKKILKDTQKGMFYCPTVGKEIPEDWCPGACYICTAQNRNGKEIYRWSD
jgi:hypothetical protein